MSTMKPDVVWYPPQFPALGRWLTRLVFITVAILLTGCDRPAKEESISGGSGTIEAVNHTHWAINHFSVDGQSGLDIIGPWQGGGGGCCYGAQVVLAGTRKRWTRFKGTDKAVHGTERLYFADVHGDSGSHVHSYGPSPEKAPVD